MIGSALHNLTLVYLGSSLPKYAKRNLIYLQKTFPNLRVTLISDLEKNLKFAEKIGVDIFKVESSPSIWPNLQALSHPKDFRRNFWENTLARFKALEIFMSESGTKSLIHIEADVLLSPNFPFAEISKFTSALSYPSVAKNESAGSIFYVKTLKSLQKFNEFCDFAILKNNDLTDMTLLSNFKKEFPDLVTELPSQLASNSKKSASQGDFSGIFDAATWGMYLAGQDSRNRKGSRIVYGKVQNHFIDPSLYNYEFDAENSLIVSNKQNAIELYCLHIHSKDIQMFKYPWPSKKLLKRISKREKDQILEFEFGVFVNLFLFKVKREMNFVINKNRKLN